MAAAQVHGVWLNEFPGAVQQNSDVTTSGSEQVQFSSAALLPAPIRAPPVAVEVAQSPQHQRVGLGGWALTSVARLSWQGLCRCLGSTSSRSFQVRYPWHFKGYLVVVLIVAIYWVVNYALVVLPIIEAIDNQPCVANDDQLTYNAKMLFRYFIWLAVARTSLFMPCIASRVVPVQHRTHGFCLSYFVHFIIRDGPLYIFVIGSMFFWFHLLRNPYCKDRSLSTYQTLRLYAVYSCVVSVLCMFLVCRHNKLLMDAAQSRPTLEHRGAPPGTLEKLETRAYDEALFGDEEGKPYPSECAICLGTWDEDNVIKVTPCGHAFHSECLGGWFRNARTCALCRHDCTSTPASSRHSFGWQESSQRARAVGAPADLAAAAGLPPGDATTSSEYTPGSPALVAEAAAVDEAVGAPTDLAAAARLPPGSATKASEYTPGSLAFVAEAAAVDKAVGAPTDLAAAARLPLGSATKSSECTPGSLAFVAEAAAVDEAVGTPTDDAAAARLPPGNATTSSDYTPGSPAFVAAAAAVDEDFDDLEAPADELDEDDEESQYSF